METIWIKDDLNWNRRKKTFEQKWWHWFNKSKKYVFNANGSESKWNRTMHTTAAIHLVVGFFLMFNLLISFIYSFFFSRSLPLCFLSLCPCAQQCHRWIVRHSTKVKCTEQLNRTGESQAGYERTNEQHSITDSAVSLTHSANSHL